jgi:hypothetical protein
MRTTYEGRDAEEFLAGFIELDSIDAYFPTTWANSDFCTECSSDDLMTEADSHDGYISRVIDVLDKVDQLQNPRIIVERSMP